MAKYGLFSSIGEKPLQEYEGDSMTQDKQFVYIWKKTTGQPGRGEQVAAIHLEAGQSVKLTKD
jgi:hypothetical protein